MTGSTRAPSHTRHKSPESRMHENVHVRFGGRLPGKGPGSHSTNTGPRWAAHPTRLSRRFYSLILLFKSYAADLLLCHPRRDLGRPPSAIRPWTPGSGVRAVHGPWVNRPRTGTDRPTDGHGPAHGRERKRPRTGPAGAVMQTALTRIPALTCHFRMPAPCRRRPRHRGLARCPGCRGPRRCAGWLRWPGRRCSGRRS